MLRSHFDFPDVQYMQCPFLFTYFETRKTNGKGIRVKMFYKSSLQLLLENFFAREMCGLSWIYPYKYTYL